jgi:hypothetical protein
MVSMAIGLVLALLVVRHFHGLQTVGDEVSLRMHQATLSTSFRGRTIAAKAPGEYDATYVAGDDEGPEGVWLGNSQLHTVNQYEEGDETAPHYASEALGWPVWGLSLPNANPQEQYVILHFALTRRQPSVLVMQLTFNTLRRDELRQELNEFVDEATLESLRTTELGRELATVLATEEEPLASISSAQIDPSQSLQDRSEAALEAALSSIWPMWRDRGDTLAIVRFRLFLLRNRVFGITAATKRSMLMTRYDRNMRAFEAILELAQQRGLPTLAYICPLRQDIDPPYVMSEYTRWKEEVQRLCDAFGARYADLDRTVEGPERWGTLGHTGEIDFMHFRVEGHRILGARVAELIRSMGVGQGGS